MIGRANVKKTYEANYHEANFECFFLVHFVGGGCIGVVVHFVSMILIVVLLILRLVVANNCSLNTPQGHCCCCCCCFFCCPYCGCVSYLW